MKCLKCNSQMIKGQLHSNLIEVYFTYKKKGIFEPEHRSRVEAYVCPECGYIELKADKPEEFKNLQNNKIIE